MPHSPVSEAKLVGFPARCLLLRQKLSVSKLELAHWLGVGRDYVTALEKGLHAPSRPVFQLIEKLEAEANLQQLAMHIPQPDTAHKVSDLAGLPPQAIEALERLIQGPEQAAVPAKPSNPSIPRKKTEFAKRVVALRAQMGITRPKLAQRLGVSRQYVTKIENGAQSSLPVIKLIEKLEAEIQNKSLSEASAPDHDSNVASAPAPVMKPVSIPPTMFGLAAPVSGTSRIAALPMLTIPAARGLTAPAQAAFAAAEHFPFSVSDPDAFAMRLAGDAMLPQHHDGEVAVLYPNSAPHTGNRVIARLSDSLGGDVLFRIYSTANHGHCIVLSSLNRLYPPVTLSPEEIVWIYPVAATVRQMLQ